MRWRGRKGSSNIEDRRGSGGLGRGGRIRIPMGAGGRRAGFGGIGFIIFIVIISAVFGINPMKLLGGLPGGGQIAEPGCSGPEPHAGKRRHVEVRRRGSG